MDIEIIKCEYDSSSSEEESNEEDKNIAADPYNISQIAMEFVYSNIADQLLKRAKFTIIDKMWLFPDVVSSLTDDEYEIKIVGSDAKIIFPEIY